MCILVVYRFRDGTVRAFVGPKIATPTPPSTKFHEIQDRHIIVENNNSHKCATQMSKMISQKCVCLVGKSFPDPVGVFCTIPDPPNCHIMQKSVFFFVIFWIISKFPYSPYLPFKGTSWNLAVPTASCMLGWQRPATGFAMQRLPWACPPAKFHEIPPWAFANWYFVCGGLGTNRPKTLETLICVLYGRWEGLV